MSEIGPYGLILANDITDDAGRALKLSVDVAPYLDAMKIGISTAALERDFGLLGRVKDTTGRIVIADFKVADVGVKNKQGAWEGTNEKIVRKAVNAGADYVICHTISGTSSIQECVDVGHSMGARILTLPYMTHVGAELFFGHPIDAAYSIRVLEKLGIDADIEECRTISDLILVLGETLNVDGYIGPANNPAVLSRYREFSQKPIYGPGIGRQARDGSTPEQQLQAFYEICGSNSAPIIGSAIYGADDPAKAAEEFMIYRDNIAARMRG